MVTKRKKFVVAYLWLNKPIISSFRLFTLAISKRQTIGGVNGNSVAYAVECSEVIDIVILLANRLFSELPRIRNSRWGSLVKEVLLAVVEIVVHLRGGCPRTKENQQKL